MISSERFELNQVDMECAYFETLGTLLFDNVESGANVFVNKRERAFLNERS